MTPASLYIPEFAHTTWPPLQLVTTPATFPLIWNAQRMQKSYAVYKMSEIWMHWILTNTPISFNNSFIEYCNHEAVGHINTVRRRPNIKLHTNIENY